ncbi:DDE-type integrase/transposase/recombinase [Nitrososphaera viennensis]|uniref:DDE-type integrase/transposase/recombinase n=3 Tax=Nitrososphaera viennensis TaxID=1034015 RepID=A0A977ICM0_9ARCH|nr:DDE-type integrase/transposase/recombinase [Nitrososphaera viennensis]AIC16403.1 putative integrase family protein [Nitrososphaera viennensis EN76]UVS68336.1 DDE-type integrase/transposase/recombinase [Nitrososphaera viennensis]
MQEVNYREQRGKAIAETENAVRKLDENTFAVKSQSGKGEYTVINSELGYLCSCPDSLYRGVVCKHAFAVAIRQQLHASILASKLVVEPLSVQNCIFCQSANLKKYGIRKNKSGNIQRFLCANCTKTFSINIGFEKMKHDPKAVTTAMQLYFSGESLRNTQRSLRLIGIDVSYVTVYRWIGKYVTLMQDYVEKLQPPVSDTWRADEIYVKIKGDMKYVFALMDDETRYWIAQEVADTKYKHDARSIFRKGKELTGKKPMKLITDGLPAYRDAYLKEFWTLKKETRTEHVNTIKLAGNMQNNKMERMNGEIRDREKVMRGLKKRDSPILKGIQLYHNAIREHQGLNGKTPLEVCGIKVEGENKWITLIQNATETINRRAN